MTSNPFRSGGGYAPGLLVSLNGVALWFLAVLGDAYVSKSSLPWDSVPGVYHGMVEVTGSWVTSPGVSGWELAGYFGLILTFAGLAWVTINGPITAGVPAVRKWRRE